MPESLESEKRRILEEVFGTGGTKSAGWDTIAELDEIFGRRTTPPQTEPRDTDFETGHVFPQAGTGNDAARIPQPRTKEKASVKEPDRIWRGMGGAGSLEPRFTGLGDRIYREREFLTTDQRMAAAEYVARGGNISDWTRNLPEYQDMLNKGMSREQADRYMTMQMMFPDRDIIGNAGNAGSSIILPSGQILRAENNRMDVNHDIDTFFEAVVAPKIDDAQRNVEERYDEKLQKRYAPKDKSWWETIKAAIRNTPPPGAASTVTLLTQAGEARRERGPAKIVEEVLSSVDPEQAASYIAAHLADDPEFAAVAERVDKLLPDGEQQISEAEIEKFRMGMRPEQRKEYDRAVEAEQQRLTEEQEKLQKAASNAWSRQADKLQSGIVDRLVEEMARRNMPKNELEAFARTAYGASIPGMLAEWAIGSIADDGGLHARIMQQAMEKYNPSLATRIGGEAAALLLSGPVFSAGGALGKAGVAGIRKLAERNVLKRLASRGITQGAGGVARRLVAAKPALQLAQGAVASGTTLGTFDAASATLGMAAAGETPRAGDILGATGRGFATGMLLPGIGRVAGRAADAASSRLGKYAAELGGFGAENAAFVGMGTLYEGLRTGEWGSAEQLAEDFGHSVGVLGIMKSIGALKRARAKNPGFYNKVLAETEFTPEEMEALDRAGVDGRSYKRAVFDLLNAKETASGREVAERAAEQLGSRYADVLQSPEVPISAKAKLMYLVEGRIPARTPLATDAVRHQDAEGRIVVDLIDPAGNLVQRRRFDAERKAEAFEHESEGLRKANRIHYYENTIEEMQARKALEDAAAEYAAERGMPVETVMDEMFRYRAGQPHDDATVKRVVERGRELLREGGDIAEMISDGLSIKYNLGEGELLAIRNKREADRTTRERAIIEEYTSELRNFVRQEGFASETGKTDARGERAGADMEQSEVRQAMEVAEREIATAKNLDDDVVYEATMRDGATVNIIKGANLVYDPETGEVDSDASDATVVVRYPDGTKKLVSIRDVDSIDEAVSAGDVRSEALKTIREQLDAAAREEALGEAVETGGLVQLMDGRIGVVEGVNEDGTFNIVLQDGEGRIVTEQMPAASIARHVAEEVVQEAAGANGGADDPLLGRSLTNEDAVQVIGQMEAEAVPAPELELTPENWVAQFGEEGKVQTPIGEVKMGENQLAKLFLKGRDAQFGMIKPTLTEPDIVLEKNAPDEKAERQTKYLFIKTFLKSDGSRYVYFESVTVSKDGMEVAISNHEADGQAIKKEMQNGKILHLSKKLSSSSDRYLTETPSAEGPDLVPSSDNSVHKDTTTIPEKQLEEPEIPRLNNGQPDYNAMPADMLAVELSAAVGHDKAVERLQVARGVNAKNMEKLRKSLEGMGDLNKAIALEQRLGEMQQDDTRLSGALEQLGAIEEPAAGKALAKNFSQEIERLFPEGLPTVRAQVLADIARGQRFVWNDSPDGAKRGVATELGFTGNESERRARFGMLGSEATGAKHISRYVHDLWQDSNGYAFDMDDAALRDEVIDVLLTTPSRTVAMEQLRDMAARMAEDPAAPRDAEDQAAAEAYARERKSIPTPDVAEQPVPDEVPFSIVGDPITAPAGITSERWNVIVDQLRRAVGAENVVTDPEQVRMAYERIMQLGTEIRRQQVAEVNERFNSQLERLTPENADSMILDLGMPSPEMLAAGIADKPLRLYGNKLLRKAQKHGYAPSDVRDLPEALERPIAIFKGSSNKSFAVLTEIKVLDQNILVTLKIGKGIDIDFNVVSSVYGKTAGKILRWINNNKLLFADKGKTLNYLHYPAPIAETLKNPESVDSSDRSATEGSFGPSGSDQELVTATNIVTNFENPKIGPENVRSESSEMRYFRTPEGEVYGFTIGGKIYLDGTRMNAETPMHEYTELWSQIVARENPELWARGVELMKQTLVWGEVNADPNYKDLPEELRASETLSRIVADEFAGKQAAITDSAALLGKLRSWLRKFWGFLKETFSKWTKRELTDLTAKKFAQMPLRDFVEGIDLRKALGTAQEPLPASGHKQMQLEIIERYNPMTDDVHAGIRSIEDIKSFDEVVQEARQNGVTYPDMNVDMLEEAAKKGWITVYSSYPIKQGVFVTPSKMNAQDYAGGGRVYSKVVPIGDVAWIAQDEGQYAKTGMPDVANPDIRFNREFIERRLTTLEKLENKRAELIADRENIANFDERLAAVDADIEAYEQSDPVAETFGKDGADAESFAHLQAVEDAVYDIVRKEGIEGVQVDVLRSAEALLEYARSNNWARKDVEEIEQGILNPGYYSDANVTILAPLIENRKAATGVFWHERTHGVTDEICTSERLVQAAGQAGTELLDRALAERGYTSDRWSSERQADEYISRAVEILAKKGLLEDYLATPEAYIEPIEAYLSERNVPEMLRDCIVDDCKYIKDQKYGTEGEVLLRTNDNGGSAAPRKSIARLRPDNRTTVETDERVDEGGAVALRRGFSGAERLSAADDNEGGVRADGAVGVHSTRGGDLEQGAAPKLTKQQQLIADLRRAVRETKASARTVAQLVSRRVREQLGRDLVQVMGKREFDAIIRQIEAATVRREVEKPLQRIAEIVLDLEIKEQQRLLDKYLALKVEGRGPRGVSVAKEVDDRTRRMFEIVRNNLDRPAEDVAAELREQEDVDFLPDMDAVAILEAYQEAQRYRRETADIEQESADIRVQNTALRRKRIQANVIGNKPEFERLKTRIAANNETLDALDAERLEVKEQLARALKEAADLLSGSIGVGREELRKFREKQELRRKTILKNAFADVDDGSKIPILDQRPGVWKKGYRRTMDFLLAPAYSLNYLLKMISVNAPKGEGATYDHFMRSVFGYVEARGSYYMGFEEFKRILDEKAREVFGKSYIEVMADSNTPVQATITITDGKVVEQFVPTIGEAMYIYMVNKMSDGAVKLRRMGIVPETVEMLADILPPQYIRFADWLQEEFLPERRKTYNATHLALFGIQMARIEHYIKMKVQKSFVHREVDGTESDPDTLPSAITGSIIKRVRNRLVLDLHTNALDLILEYGQEMERWNAFSRVVLDMNALLSSTAFRRMLDARNPGLHKRLKVAAQIAVDSYRPQTNDVNRAWIALGKLAASSKIAFRINTALKQLLSYPSFYAYSADPKFWALLTKNLAPTTWAKNFRWCLKNIPSFRERWKGRMAGNEKLAQMTAPALDKWLDKMNKYGMAPNAFVDALTCANGAKAVYDFRREQYFKRGITESEADRRAKIDAAVATNETQQSSEGMYLSQMQLDRDFWSVSLSTFQNSSFSYLRKQLEGIDELFRNVERERRNRAGYYKALGMGDDVALDLAIKDVAAAKKEAWANIFMFQWLLNIIWRLGGKVWKYAFVGAAIKELWPDIKKAAMIASIRNTSIGSITESFADGYDANPSVLLSDLIAFSRRFKRIVEAENPKTWDQTAAYLTLQTLTANGLGVDLESFVNMYQGISGMIRDGYDVEDLMLLLNAPKSQAKLIAGKPKEGESLDDYQRRLGYIERRITANIDKKQTSKWTRNYTAYRQAELLGLTPERDKTGYVHVPELREVDDAYAAVLKEAGMKRNGTKRPDSDAFRVLPTEMKRELRRRVKEIGALQKQLDDTVVFNEAYAGKLRQLMRLKREVVEMWKK